MANLKRVRRKMHSVELAASNRVEVLAEGECILHADGKTWSQIRVQAQEVFRCSYDPLLGGYWPEEPFYVVRWPNAVWVLEEAPGSEDLVTRLKNEGVPVNERTLFVIPWTWRKRLLGFIPLFPIVRSGQFPLGSLPADIDG